MFYKIFRIIILLFLIKNTINEKILILLSLDGFRHDYISMYGQDNKFPTLER
jgi:predicted AlkP superfamily pyrophosphatase or phosphodiesterase